LIPSIVSAATSALTIASSVASAAARKSGLMRSFGSICRVATPSIFMASGFAVEKAMKMSPEELLAMPPVRATPMLARRAMRFS